MCTKIIIPRELVLYVANNLQISVQHARLISRSSGLGIL